MSVTFLRYPATYHWRLFPCCRRSFSQAALAPSSTSVLQPHREPYASADTSPNCNAQQQGIQQSGKSIHDFIKVESHLASIRAAGLDPTLEDIEKFRPARHSRPDTRKYADQYCKLRDAICRAFSKDQLRRFTELYELDAMLSHPKRRKIEYAESIIEQQWGWPSLKEIERRRMDRTEVISKSFHLSPSELFLILGKDGADLLELSIQYNVHVSLASDPLSLRVEGLRGALEQVSEHIDNLKKDIREETYELPTRRSIPADLVQRISRLAGAYVENCSKGGKIKISARNITSMRTAERLATRASLERGVDGQANIFCYDPPDIKNKCPVPTGLPHHYSAYPFLTPSPSPWMMRAGKAFRIRHVADWFGLNSCEDIRKTGGLASNENRFIDLVNMEQDHQAILANFQHTTRHRLITASLGHLLFCEDSQQASLVPPLRGGMPLHKALSWLRTTQPEIIFVPSFPNSTVPSPREARRVLHRLVYKTLSTSTPEMSPSSGILPVQVLNFETELFPKLSTNTQHDDESQVTPPAYLTSYNPSVPKYQIGQETILNLMIPDRPMDIQFTVLDYQHSPEHQPPALSSYFLQLREFATTCGGDRVQPYPPPAVDFQGNTYYLHNSWSLQQTTRSITVTTPDGAGSTEQHIQAVYEKVFDLESGQKLELCKVKFDPFSGTKWKDFLAVCDQFSAALPPLRNREEVEYSE